MVKLWYARCDGEPESDTWTWNGELPACEGVPEIAPLADNVRPAGSDPEAMVQLYGEVPPEAASEAV
jgi:hypothetical protein